MPGIGGGPEVKELLIDDEVRSPWPLVVDELDVEVSVRELTLAELHERKCIPPRHPSLVVGSSFASHHLGSSALHDTRSL